MCKVEVSYSGGSTGTMSNHLKHVHKSVKTEVNDGKPKIVQKLNTNTTHIWPFWLASTVHNGYVWDDPSNFAATNLAVCSKLPISTHIVTHINGYSSSVKTECLWIEHSCTALDKRSWKPQQKYSYLRWKYSLTAKDCCLFIIFFLVNWYVKDSRLNEIISYMKFRVHV